MIRALLRSCPAPYLVGLCVLAAACAQRELPATQIVVLVNGDEEVAKGLSQVGVKLYALDAEEGSEPAQYLPFDLASGEPGTGQVRFPFSFGIARGADTSFLLVVEGYKEDEDKAVIEQKAIVSFQAGQTLLLKIYLRYACYQLAQRCTGLGETCHAGDDRGEGECGTVEEVELERVNAGQEFVQAGMQDGSIPAGPDGADGTDAGETPIMEGGMPAADAGAAFAENALASRGEPCAEDGVFACEGHDSRTPLRCAEGSWQAERPCAESERCDSRVGASQGVCASIPTSCLGRAPDEQTCDGTARRACGPDLVTLGENSCPENAHCADAGSVTCVCDSGYVEDGERCVACGSAGQSCCAGEKCGDGDPCNGTEACVAGTCEAGKELRCSDDNSCTSDRCVRGVGCENKRLPDDASCDDGDGCTRTDTCQEGVCRGENPVLCSAPTPICREGACIAPTSCPGLPEKCGPARANKCCEPVAVPGGSFLRSYDKVTATDDTHPASISAFSLDRLEVTVGRFRRFIEAGGGTQASPPAAGAGQTHGLAGSGWDAAWNASLRADKVALVAALKCQPSFEMWTDLPESNETRPMNCVNWYEAFAFCIWDSGRLPTEAEWNFAAAGGDEQRVYPWSIPASSAAIDASRASYYVDNTLQCYGDGVADCVGSDIVVAGAKSGPGAWGHLDLAGNLAEWVLDYYAAYKDPCLDCAQLAPSTDRVMRGGSFGAGDYAVTAAWREDHHAPLTRSADFGFRCVYGR